MLYEGMGEAAHVESAELRPSRNVIDVTPLLDDVATKRGSARRARDGRRRGWLVRRMLVLADVVGLVLAFLVVGAASAGLDWNDGIFAIVSLPLWIIIARLYHLYDQDEERTHHPTTDDFVGVFHLVTIGTWIMFAGLVLADIAQPTVTNAVLFWASAILFITVARTIARAVSRKSVLYLQNTIILGGGDVGQRVGRKLLRHPEYGLRLVGFVDSDPKPRHGDLGDLRLLGSPSELSAIVDEFNVERVIVAFSGDSADRTLAALRELNNREIQIDVIPRLFELVGPSVKIDSLEGLPLIELPPARLSPSSQLIKRTFDVLVASVLLLLTAPLFAVIALAIRFDSSGPIFFRQTRLGRNQREFTTLKFRTMTVGSHGDEHRKYIQKTMNADLGSNGNGLYKLERPDAITGVGRILRKTSLDELPQLINVLRGDMSLVGPRPCIPYETEFFKPHQFDRFLVPAGITGLWQVTARAYATFGEALDMDVAYARGWSLGLDLRLLCRTPIAVLRGKGAA
jgi:exopolysaccharide biosynthesis polyprenyl glycosylphosphotransferase